MDLALPVFHLWRRRVACVIWPPDMLACGGSLDNESGFAC